MGSLGTMPTNEEKLEAEIRELILLRCGDPPGLDLSRARLIERIVLRAPHVQATDELIERKSEELHLLRERARPQEEPGSDAMRWKP